VPNPPALNAAIANVALAQHPALRNLSQDELTALLYQLSSGQMPLQPVAQAQPAFPSANHLGVALDASPITSDRATTSGVGPDNGARSAGNSSLEEGEVSDASMS